MRSHDRTAEAHPLRDAVLAVALGAGAVAWAVFPGNLVVESPSFGGPEILTPGGELEVVGRVAVPWVTAIDELTLESGPIRISLPLVRPPKRGARQTVLARVPSDCRPGNYDLVVRAGNREARAHRAVALLDSIPERFTLAQITDLHFGNTSEGEASVARIVDELNRLSPAVVVVTGDLTQNGKPLEFERATRTLDRLTMPVVCIPGNHDLRGWAGYLTAFGFPYHLVKFGHWTLLGLDSGHGREQFTESQLRFVERALNAAEPGKVIGLVHIPLAGKRSVKAYAKEVMDLFERRHVPLVLSGHWHYGAEYGGSGRGTANEAAAGTRFIVTATAGGSLVKAPGGRSDPRGFTLVTVEDGRVTSVESHRPGAAGAKEADQ